MRKAPKTAEIVLTSKNFRDNIFVIIYFESCIPEPNFISFFDLAVQRKGIVKNENTMDLRTSERMVQKPRLVTRL